MPAGTEVFVTFLPQESVLRTVEICVGLRGAGFTPVPHIAARGFPDVSVLDDYLTRAHGEAGVDRALVIAGDIDTPKGPFSQSLDLLQTGLLQKHGIKLVAFAGHPEGHPKAPDDVMFDALKRKIAYARESRHGRPHRHAVLFRGRAHSRLARRACAPPASTRRCASGWPARRARPR